MGSLLHYAADSQYCHCTVMAVAQALYFCLDLCLYEISDVILKA